MKRHIWLAALALICILALTGCQCKHEWKDATCDAPKTCSLCDATEGAPLGHTWKAATCTDSKTCEICKTTEGQKRNHTWTDATCTAPKTCTACGLTEGEALPHTWVDADCDTAKTCSVCAITEGAPLGHTWQAATCETAKTCTVCAVTDGEALGHSWTKATCTTPKACSICKATEGKAPGHKWMDATTDTPKTCQTCGVTEGKPIQTNKLFQTKACKFLFGTWKHSDTVTAADLGVTNQTGSFQEITVYTFHNVGTITLSVEVDDVKTCKNLMQAGIIANLCLEHGTREAAEAVVQQYFNMSLEEYAADFTNSYLDTLQNTKVNYVYFVGGDYLYIAPEWDGTFESYEYFVKGDTLTLVNDYDDRTDFTRS